MNLVKPWGPRIRPYINDIDTGGDQGRQNETIAPFGGIIITTATGIPTRMMQFILQIGHGQPVNHLDHHKMEKMLLK